MSPAVTILMPVYNGQAFLREAVDSVLRQSFRDFELLVVDDGSTDDSVAILQGRADPRIRIVRNARNLGLVASLNRGLAEARGRWVARADADDVNHPVRIERQLPLLERGFPAVGSDVMLIDADGHFRGHWRAARHAEGLAWDLGFRCCFAHGSVMFDPNRVRGLGGYRESVRSEDWELWSRMVRAGERLATVPATLVRYRQHGRSIMAGGGSADHAETLGRLRRAQLAWILGPNAPAGSIEVLCRPWETDRIGPAYFRERGRAAAGFAPGERLRDVLADEDYMLYFRILRCGRRRALAFLRLMMRGSAESSRRFPWTKAAGMLVLQSAAKR